MEDIPPVDVGAVQAMSNCGGNITVAHIGDVSDGNTCPQVIMRTYRASDEAGNTSDCIQIITIDDQAAPIITCPADLMVSCLEDVPVADISLVTVTDNCLGTITIVHVGDVSDGNTCPQVITRPGIAIGSQLAAAVGVGVGDPLLLISPKCRTCW